MAWRDTQRAVEKAQAATIGTVADTLKATAFAIEGSVTLDSPVDTGRFRANWVASLDEPSTETVYTDAQQRAAEKDSLYRPFAFTGAARWTEGALGGHWLSNNLDYAEHLVEDGSIQNDPGWLDAAIRKGIRRVRRRV